MTRQQNGKWAGCIGAAAVAVTCILFIWTWGAHGEDGAAAKPDVIGAANGKAQDVAVEPQLGELFGKCESVEWGQITDSIYEGPIHGNVCPGLSHDLSKLVLCSLNAKKRTSTVAVYSVLHATTTNMDVLNGTDEKNLTIKDYRIGPGTNNLWLQIGIVDVAGWSEWFQYDLASGQSDKESKKFARLRDASKNKPDAVPGPESYPPEWSQIGWRLFMGIREAEKAGFRARWDSADNAPYRSSVTMNGIEYELLVGNKNRGHIFANGQYVASITLACPWVPQRTWFVHEGQNTSLYLFGGANGNISKSVLRDRKIMHVWNLPGKGIIVHSWGKDKEYVELIKR